MGVKPEAAALQLQEMDLFALGANCGTGSDELIEAIREMRKAAPEAVLVAKANAGIPQVIGSDVVYNGSPEVMRDYARKVYQEGARLIGGCCGNTPAHVKAMAEALQKLS
jgi:5-methyltetrahydrofolate--homocysteine methyltransferase